MDHSPEQLAQEELRKNELYYAQQRNLQQEETRQSASAIKKPSLIGYGALFALAIVLDVIDAIEFTGVGIIPAKIIQVFATIFFIAISFFVNRRIKRMRSASDVIGTSIESKMRQITAWRQRYARGIQIARKIKFLRKPLRTFVLATKKITRITRNPIIKNFIANALEFIPFVGAFPFQTIGLYLMYRDHRKTYEEAQAVLAQMQEVQEIEDEEFSEEQIRKYEELMSQSEGSIQ